MRTMDDRTMGCAPPLLSPRACEGEILSGRTMDRARDRVMQCASSRSRGACKEDILSRHTRAREVVNQEGSRDTFKEGEWEGFRLRRVRARIGSFPSHQAAQSPSHQAQENSPPSHQAVGEQSPSHEELDVLETSQAYQGVGDIHQDYDELDTCATQASTTICKAEMMISILLNTNHVCRHAIIVKLVTHMAICSCIEEVLSTIPIESQAKYNKRQVQWEDCVPPYAVDERAYMNHTRGRNEGLPRDPNPLVQTSGE